MIIDQPNNSVDLGYQRPSRKTIGWSNQWIEEEFSW